MRYLLDTNILSALGKPRVPEALVAWMSDRYDDELCVSALSVAEIRRGILLLSAGPKREALEHWCAGPDGLKALFDGRVLPFDDRAALVWGRLMADGNRSGRPRSALDMIIAATAEVHGCVVVTANERDFVGTEIFNPLR